MNREEFKSIATALYNNPNQKAAQRMIGLALFELPQPTSGMVSTGLLCEYGYRPPISKCTKEHYHSRNLAALKVMELLKAGEDIDSWLDECTTVHLTTKAENIRLSRIQNDDDTKDLSWQKQYKLAGIKLVKDPGTMPVRLRNKLKKV